MADFARNWSMIELLSCWFISVTEKRSRVIHVVKMTLNAIESSVPLNYALIKTPSTLSNIINDDYSFSIKRVKILILWMYLLSREWKNLKNSQNDDQNH